MNIILGDKWNITQDKYQFILRKIKINKETGEQYFGESRFYLRLSQLIDRLFELELLDREINTLNDITVILNATRKWIDTANLTDLKGKIV